MRGPPAAAATPEPGLEVSFADLAARYEDDDDGANAAVPSAHAELPAPQAAGPAESGAAQVAAAPAEEEAELLDEWEPDSDDDYADIDFPAERGGGGSAVFSKSGARKLQPSSNNMQKLASRLKLGLIERRAAAEEERTWEPEHMAMDASVRTALRQSTDKQLVGRSRAKDRADRATVETVLDDRTRMVLFKMLNNGTFCEIHGCISTGKEANVYHAVTAEGADLAVKVYKTSILVFKDRDRYVSGDPRFTSYGKHNPRKMVRMWAEKEMRNLARLHAAGVRCPRPHVLRQHVLVMDLIGVDGVAALRLKDARVPVGRLQSMYTEMVLLLRKLYQECRLVHGDLSEYNILVNQGELYIIDVSQAVDLDHPRALDFLREDAAHVNAFFRRAGIAALTTRELFEFVVDPNIHAGNVAQALDRLAAAAAARPAAAAAEEQTADNVFAQTHVPRALEEVADHEAHFDRLAKGDDVEGIYYQTITGMRHDMTGARQGPAYAEARPQAADTAEAASAAVPLTPPADASEVADGRREGGECEPPGSEAFGSDSEESSSGSGSSSDKSEGEGEGGRPRAPVDQEAARAAKKEHKREVKEAKRERRKTKIPKHVKKKHARKKR